MSNGDADNKSAKDKPESVEVPAKAKAPVKAKVKVKVKPASSEPVKQKNSRRPKRKPRG